MEINKRKSEVMIVSRQREVIGMRVDDAVLELADTFKRLDD